MKKQATEVKVGEVVKFGNQKFTVQEIKEIPLKNGKTMIQFRGTSVHQIIRDQFGVKVTHGAGALNIHEARPTTKVNVY